jgi:hypothetical protein
MVFGKYMCVYYTGLDMVFGKYMCVYYTGLDMVFGKYMCVYYTGLDMVFGKYVCVYYTGLDMVFIKVKYVKDIYMESKCFINDNFVNVYVCRYIYVFCVYIKC